MIGKTLGHYTITEEIGAGGMGRVYRAFDARLEREVAIKVLPPGLLTDAEARKRFRREALALSKLNHPNIATVHDFDSQEDSDFLVMENIAGQTLEEKLESGPLSEKEIVRLGVQLAEGLSAAHSQGVLHRDLKPGNLRLTAEGRLKILDFGLAKVLPQASHSAATESNSRPLPAGTLPYMSPEQLLNEKLDGRSDIYSAGNVLYEMATGQKPFEAESSSRLIDEILRQPPVTPRARNGRVSSALENVILKCLEKDPDNRYQSANELAVDLRRIGSSVSSTAAATPRRGWRRGRLAVVVALVLLAAAAGLWALRNWLKPKPAALRIESLAVLPLENLSGDSGQDYFADGMTEELINRLGRLSGARVISRTSVMQYKGVHNKPLREIARELGADAVVEGSVARVGGRVRITAELVSAANERHLWGDSYNRELRDVLGIQDEVAEAIARQISGTLLTQGPGPLGGSHEVDPAVYEAYLRGRYEWNKRTAEGTSAALDDFRKAIATDSRYAPAYAGLADCYVTLWLSLSTLSREQALPQARDALQKALQLDPDLAEAHSTLGVLRMYADWDWAGAEAEFKRAILLNPSYATARHWYGLHQAFLGNAREARQQLERARELDPLSAIIQLNLAWSEFVAGDSQALVSASQKVLETAPGFWDAHWDLGTAYVQQGELEKGIAELQKAVELSNHSPATLSSLGYAQARAGRRAEAEQTLQTLQQRALHEPVGAEEIAMVYIGLSDNNNALRSLEEALRDHSKGLVLLKADPWYHSLAAEPRYQELLRRTGLAAK